MRLDKTVQHQLIKTVKLVDTWLILAKSSSVEDTNHILYMPTSPVERFGEMDELTDMLGRAKDYVASARESAKEYICNAKEYFYANMQTDYM